MNFAQEQITQLIGQKELDNYALHFQIQQLQQTLQERDTEIESLKEQLTNMEPQNGSNI